MSKTDLIPRIESTATGGIVLVDEVIDSGIKRTDLIAQREDESGLPESFTDTLWSLLSVSSDYDGNRPTILRLIAEYAGANYSRGFRAGRLAERDERG